MRRQVAAVLRWREVQPVDGRMRRGDVQAVRGVALGRVLRWSDVSRHDPGHPRPLLLQPVPAVRRGVADAMRQRVRARLRPKPHQLAVRAEAGTSAEPQSRSETEPKAEPQARTRAEPKAGTEPHSGARS